MVTRILGGGDLLTTDIKIALDYKNAAESQSEADSKVKEQYEDLFELFERILSEQTQGKWKKGDPWPEKTAIEEWQMEALLQAAKSLKNTGDLAADSEGFAPGGTISSGGSSYNTLLTLSRMLKNQVQVDFLGVLGSDRNSTRIRGELKSGNINLIPEIPAGEEPQGAVSLAFNFKGSRAIFTYPGTAKNYLKEALLNDQLIEKYDVIFAQGSAWNKFDREFVDKVMDLRFKHHKELWIALPTQSSFKEDMSAEAYQWLLSSADVIMGNHEELMRLYKTNRMSFEEYKQHPDLLREDRNAAFAKLQEAMREHKPLLQKEWGVSNGKLKSPVAFITCGKEGAYVIRPSGQPQPISIAKVDTNKPLNETGAGDASFAGFLAGLLSRFNLVDAGRLGMEVAAAKVEYADASCLPDPLKALRERGADSFLRKLALAPYVHDPIAAQAFWAK